MNTKLKFAFEKETKGAVRYQEVGEDGAPAYALHPQKRNAGRQNPENTYCYYRRRTNLISEARVEETPEAVESHAVHGRGAHKTCRGYMARVGRFVAYFSELRDKNGTARF
jgi:hypothetical protein